MAIPSPIITKSDVPQSLQSNKPNDLPLNIILYGTLVLALYSAPATLLLGAEIINGGSSMIPRSSVIYLFAASLIGFTLFFGYFRTAVTKRHSTVFWIYSSIYNLHLVCVYLFEVAYKRTFVGEIATESNQVIVPLLLSFWTMLASACSLYYVFNAWRAKQQKLD